MFDCAFLVLPSPETYRSARFGASLHLSFAIHFLPSEQPKNGRRIFERNGPSQKTAINSQKSGSGNIACFLDSLRNMKRNWNRKKGLSERVTAIEQTNLMSHEAIQNTSTDGRGLK
jgi:hypothetical protein